MAEFLIDFSNYLIVGGLYLMFGFVFIIIFNKIRVNLFEPLIRLFSALTGYILFLGSKVIGISLPEIILSSMTIMDPVVSNIVLGGITCTLGFFVAQYLIKIIQKSGNDIPLRIAIIFAVFILFVLTDIYSSIETMPISSQQEELNLLIPNITFVGGVLLFFILKFDTSSFNYTYKFRWPWKKT